MSNKKIISMYVAESAKVRLDELSSELGIAKGKIFEKILKEWDAARQGPFETWIKPILEAEKTP